jgi:hypothetical protein
MRITAREFGLQKPSTRKGRSKEAGLGLLGPRQVERNIASLNRTTMAVMADGLGHPEVIRHPAKPLFRFHAFCSVIQQSAQRWSGFAVPNGRKKTFFSVTGGRKLDRSGLAVEASSVERRAWAEEQPTTRRTVKVDATILSLHHHLHHHPPIPNKALTTHHLSLF